MIAPSIADRVAPARVMGALVLPLAAFALQRAFWPTTHHFTCLLFYPAVFLSSWLGGFYAGLASTALSVVLVWLFFAPPEGNTDPGNLLSLGVFIGMGVLFTTFHDRLRAADRRLARANAQIHQLREEWAAIVAHDLQQPIHTIVLRADLLLRAEPNAGRSHDVEHIRTSAKRLSQMVNDLSDASVLEAHRMKLSPERLDLRAVVEGTVARSADATSRAEVHAPVNPVHVRADAGRIEQVIANLLSNALKYGDPNAPIEVAIDEVGADARVSVTNRGEPIPADELPFLFERYARSRSASASRVKGSGVGLYIARGLVEAHGGRIWVESTTGATRVCFTLPLDAATSAAPLFRERSA